jgi:cytoskeletal protein CcmA (bactofilin family)
MAAASECTIGPGITVNGRLTGSEDVTVVGRVEGTVALDSQLVVAEDGEVVAEVEADTVTIEGTLDGDIVADDTVRLMPGCQVTGNIRAPRINIEEGALFKGNIDMDVEMPATE